MQNGWTYFSWRKGPKLYVISDPEDSEIITFIWSKYLRYSWKSKIDETRWPTSFCHFNLMPTQNSLCMPITGRWPWIKAMRTMCSYFLFTTTNMSLIWYILYEMRYKCNQLVKENIIFPPRNLGVEKWQDSWIYCTLGLAPPRELHRSFVFAATIHDYRLHFPRESAKQ